MRKFKLLKDLPSIPAGTVLTQSTEDGVEYLYKEEGGDYSGLTLERDAEGKDTLRYTVSFGVNYLVENLDELLEEIQPGYKRWRAERGELYYCVDSNGLVASEMESRWGCDDRRHDIGNYFKSEAEAQAYADYLKALATVRDDAKGFEPDWSDNEQPKFYVCYLPEIELLSINETWQSADNGVFGLPYFETREGAQASIEKHGAEWLTIFNCGGAQCEE